jgi:acyl-coenzyme A synthetase/AMP-(fatty) acid ligase
VDYGSSESLMIGGNHFNSAAIERKLEDLDGVAEVCILPSLESERLCLDVALAIMPGHNLERSLIEQAMAPLIGRDGPIRIHFCQSLPRTPSGKVNRAALRAALADPKERVSPATALAIS